ncbi:hypothetical protein ACHAXS_008721 [Conticribra weissflogii]
MAHYKRDAASNRDALFSGAGSGGKSKPRPGGSSRPSRPQQPTSSSSSSSTSRPAPSTTAAAAAVAPPRLSAAATPTSQHTQTHTNIHTHTNLTPGPSHLFANKPRRTTSKSTPLSLLTGQAKLDKMAVAEDFRLKAKKAMTRGIFSRPDPLAAGNYYKRAADAYKQCGENRLERLHRIASGDCQLGQEAYATAAGEYMRAAELAEVSEETLARKRQECHKLYGDAAGAWEKMGERGRSAECRVMAAFALVMGEEAGKRLDERVLTFVEAAVEGFVPDPLNKKAHYRRTGRSAYEDPNQPEGGRDLALAKENIITEAYAHETIFQIATQLLMRRHYESALYAYGAGTSSLEHEGFATVSLYRSYLSETIILLAMGDVVAAKKEFMEVHLQKTDYLTSRECALEEDLVRACGDMDEEELEEARSKTGKHRGALANLDATVRGLVMEIRVSGRAKKEEKEKPKSKPSPKAKELSGAELQKSLDDGFAEMDDIMGQLGLNDDDDDDGDDGIGNVRAGNNNGNSSNNYSNDGDDDDDDIDLT